jgi:hypothetical protein
MFRHYKVIFLFLIHEGQQILLREIVIKIYDFTDLKKT